MQLRKHSWRPLAVAAAATVAVAGGATTAIAVSAGNDDTSAAIAKAIDPAKPKNIIMMVGDGMGESEITAARYYAGVGTRLNIDKLPFRGVVETYSVDGAGKPDYVPDSASTASAWSTGVRTLDERISQTPTAAIGTPGDNNLPTTFDKAKALGKRTGNVSTAEITDATPAGPSAHISLRGCQGPGDTATSCASETKANGGLGSIAEQQVGPRHADVILGGGLRRYSQPTSAGPTVLAQARAAGFQYAPDATALDAITSLKNGPVLGLFNQGNMTTEYGGDPASHTGNAQTCTTDHRPANEPSLDAMTQKSLALLSENNDKGFFLQVEGASIDKQDHAANPCQQIGETLSFDKAIGTVLEYQKAHPDTLVVITADHSHTSQIVSPESTGTGAPTGYYQDLVTKDGSKLRLSYGTAGGATPPAAPPSQEHTGASVPVMAVGPQGANIQGVLEQTDLFSLLSFAREPSKLPAGPTTTVTGPTTTVTTPGAPTPAPVVGLTAGVAVPRSLANATARKGIPVSIVATKDAKATLTLKNGSRTIAKGTATLKAGRTTAGKLSGAKIAKKRSAKLKLTVVVTAGKEQVTRTATVSVSKR